MPAQGDAATIPSSGAPGGPPSGRASKVSDRAPAAEPRATVRRPTAPPPGPPAGRPGSPSGRAPAAPAADDPHVGKVLAGCELKRVIGKGGMASVYLAHQTDLERDVAVKILSERLTRDPRQVQQFFIEAKTLARLEHQNIATIYNVGQEEELCFLVMQLVDGGSLRDLMTERGGRFPVAEATQLVMQMAAGLGEAHRKGIVHRDVKPGNVLVAPGPTLKITDFGLAAMTDDASLKFGEVVGTPAYMSPEQADGRGVDTRTDVYSLGATFYHMLVGEPPFQGSTPEILLAHVNEPLVPPHERASDVPVGVSRIVCKMMAKSPAQRYATLEQVLDDLRKPAAETATVGAPVEAPVASARLALMDPEAALPPIEDVLGALKVERPRSLKYGVLALAVATGIFAVLGIGPMAIVISDLRAEEEAWDSPEERQGDLALVEVERAAAGPAPGVEGEPKLTDAEVCARYEALAVELPGTRAATKAEERVRQLKAKIAEDARLEAEQILAEAKRREQAGEPGPAIDALLAMTPEQRERAGKPAVEAMLDRLGKAVAAAGFARVTPGPFLSGDDAQRVELPGFYIGLREVTNGEYAKYLAKKPQAPAPQGWTARTAPPGSEELPVSGVSFVAAAAYARELGVRLPTALEWEKAARGADGRPWPWGPNKDTGACNWRRTAAPGRPARVATMRGDTSPYGCSDMAGNVAELVLGPESTEAAPRPRVQGGCFMTRNLANTRAAYARDVGQDEVLPAVGFRIAADALQGGAR